MIVIFYIYLSMYIHVDLSFQVRQSVHALISTHYPSTKPTLTLPSLGTLHPTVKITGRYSCSCRLPLPVKRFHCWRQRVPLAGEWLGGATFSKRQVFPHLGYTSAGPRGRDLPRRVVGEVPDSQTIRQDDGSTVKTVSFILWLEIAGEEKV